MRNQQTNRWKIEFDTTICLFLDSFQSSNAFSKGCGSKSGLGSVYWFGCRFIGLGSEFQVWVSVCSGLGVGTTTE